MRPRDQADAMADALRKDEGTPPVAVLMILFVPETFRGLSQSELVRKLSHPENAKSAIESMADAIVVHFNDPVRSAALIQNLTTAAERAAHGEG